MSTEDLAGHFTKVNGSTEGCQPRSNGGKRRINIVQYKFNAPTLIHELLYGLLLARLLLLLPLGAAAVKPLYGVLVEHRPWRQHNLTNQTQRPLTKDNDEGKRRTKDNNTVAAPNRPNVTRISWSAKPAMNDITFAKKGVVYQPRVFWSEAG